VFDVTDESQVREGMGSFEKLDVLVNSAGVNISRPFQELSKSDWTRVYDVNVFGLASVTRMAVPALSQADNIGKIVNIASIKGVYSSVGRAAYASSKAAVISLTTALSKELAPRILVNAVAPGFVDTEMTLNTMSARLQRQIDSILLGRIAQPIEVANAVLFLAGDKNSYITGQTLNVDGGFSIKYE
jgi:3-oxoacyl-[acyl-carrier protein] reductase